MEGPSILAQSLAWPAVPDKHGNVWQYHSRSDRHSKVACWTVLFDALLHSPTLRRHADRGDILVGVNQELRDFRTNRTKNLDLVLATPGSSIGGQQVTLADLALRWRIRLDDAQQKKLESL